MPPLRFDGRPIGPRAVAELAAPLDETGGAIETLLEARSKRTTEPRRVRLEISAIERRWIRQRTPRLTQREHEVLIALIEGGSNEQIALDLGIALPTLRTHLARISQKLGATGRADLLRCGAGLLLDGYRRGALAPLHS